MASPIPVTPNVRLLALLGRLALGRSLALLGSLPLGGLALGRLALRRSLLRGLALRGRLLLGGLLLGRLALRRSPLRGLALRGSLLRRLALRRSLLLGCRLPRASLCRRHCTTFLGVSGKRTQLEMVLARPRPALTVIHEAQGARSPRSVCTCCS